MSKHPPFYISCFTQLYNQWRNYSFQLAGDAPVVGHDVVSCGQ